MKLIRCTVPPFLMEPLVDSLKSEGDIESLMVTSGGGWHPRQAARMEVYRGREYEVRLNQEIVIEVMAQDYAADEVVRLIVQACNAASAEGRASILVMTAEDFHDVRLRPRRIA